MQYNQLIKIVQTVIDSFTNVAVAHLNGLKTYLSKTVFSVKVTNPATKMKVEGEVKVSNTQPLLKALGGIVLAINGLKKPMMADKKVEVSNFKDIKFPEMPKMPEHPKEMKISNMKEFTDAVEKVAEFVAKIKYDPRIEVKPADVHVKAPVVNVAAPVVNVPEQKPPVVNVEKPDMSKILAALKILTIVWRVNDIDNFNGTKKYVGKENTVGEWLIEKTTIMGEITEIRYASKKNNKNVNKYSSAWVNRDEISYGRFFDIS